MKLSKKQLSDSKVKLTIKVDADELKKAELVALERLGKDLKVAGFRKGKIPVSVVAKNVDPKTLEQEVLNQALNRAVSEAFVEQKLQLLAPPEVEVKKYVPNSELEFSAEAEIVPKVKLGDYQNLKFNLDKTKVDPAEINEVIERIRQGFATSQEVERAAQLEDEVLIDFVGKKNDKAFEGGTANDFNLTLGSKQFIPGFEEAIVGKKAGQKFDIKLAFPKDYHAQDLAGQEVVFAVNLKKVNQKALPELNDELAAKCGPFKSIEELKQDIKRELTHQKQREIREKAKDDLVKQLVEKSQVNLPEILINDQEKSIEQDFVQNLAYQGLSLDKYLETQKFKTKEEWLDKEVRPAAEQRVKSGLVLAELMQQLKISVSPQEIEQQVNLYKQQYANNKQALEQFKSPEVRRDIGNRLLTEKTVQKLLEINQK